MTTVGTLLAFTVDVAVPVVLGVLLARANFRHRASRRGELVFWLAAGAYLAFLTVWVVGAITATYRYEGYPTLVAVFFALPLSAIPAVFNSYAIHFFFSDAEWGEHGYFVVLTIFLAGLPAWALLAPLGVRRMIQREITRERLSALSRATVQ